MTKWDILTRIRNILQVNNQDELIENIFYLVNEKVVSYLKVEEVPKSLEWILVELSVQRFNRIGSEGISSESVEGGSTVYIEDELGPYYHFLDEYISTNNTRKGYKLF